MINGKAETISEYIAEQPKEIQKLLNELRATIKKAAPKAEECISYAIPTFTLNGNLVHFAAFKNHIGFYPAPGGTVEFEEASRYKTSKGTLQFPLDEPLPLSLVSKIVKFRVKQNLEKVASKTASKTKTKR
jgi:uncharacterized protein YdhG (YjbR/CyaY superfamily)